MKLLVIIISAVLLLTGCLNPKPVSFTDLKKAKIADFGSSKRRPSVFENQVCSDNFIDFLGFAVNEGEEVCVDVFNHQKRCYSATGQIAQAKEFLLSCAAVKLNYADGFKNYAIRHNETIHSSRYAAALLDCSLGDKADIYIRSRYKKSSKDSNKDFLTIDCKNLGLENRKDAFLHFDSLLPIFRDVRKYRWEYTIDHLDIGALIESRGEIYAYKGIPDRTKERLQGIRVKALETYVEHDLQSPNHMLLVFSAINTYGLFSTIEEYKPILKKYNVSLSKFTNAINMAYVEDNSEYSFKVSKLSINEQSFARKYLIKDFDQQLARKNKQAKLATLKFCQSDPFPTSRLNQLLGRVKRGCNARYESFIKEAKEHQVKEPIYGSDYYSASLKISKCLEQFDAYFSLEDDYKAISNKVSKNCDKSDKAMRMAELFKKDLILAKDGAKNYNSMDSTVSKISKSLNDSEARYERNKTESRQRSNTSEWKNIMEGWVPGGSNAKLQEIQSNHMKWVQDFQKNQKTRQRSQSTYIDNSSKVTASSGSQSQNNTSTYASVSSGSKATKPKPKKTTAENKKTNSCWSGYESGTGCLVTEEDKFRGDIYSVKYSNRCERRIFAKYCNLISSDKMDCGASGIAPGKTKVWSTKNGSGQHRQIYVGSLKGSEDFVCANEISGWHQFPN